MLISRCPYCGRPTAFYGLLRVPEPWTRWEECRACRLFFRYDTEAQFLGLKPGFEPSDPERDWAPPREWFLPGPERRKG